MGKWSLDHCDHILSAKIRDLVDGAIKRSKMEKADPTINYQAFVEDLDAGDSFTTSLVEILVKEIAERRTRPNTADRRLIADRSAKSLRMLAALRVYRGRTGGHDELDMEEDDDEFESMLGGHTSVPEGARINSEIYDAFGGPSHRWSHPSGRRPHVSPTGVPSAGSEDTRDVPVIAPYSPPIPTRGSPWNVPPPSSLFRQATIRRPTRSRIVDFNDFTSRRRSLVRQTTSHEFVGSRPDAPPEDSGHSVARWERPPQDESTAPSRVPQLARRFFGPSRSRRHETGAVPWNDSATESSNSEPPDELSYVSVYNPNTGPWFSFPTPSSSSSSQSEVDNGEEGAHAVPRLRRGGIRAPEVMLSRHASPNPTDSNPTSVDTVVPARLPPSPRSPVSEAGQDDGNVVASAQSNDQEVIRTGS